MSDLSLRALDCLGGEPIEVSFQDDKIFSLSTASERQASFVGPGLVDLQVNGYGGFDYNETNEDGVRQITMGLWQEGVTTHFPTVITNEPAAIAATCKLLRRVQSQDYLVGRSIAGIHVEGPFISPQDGPRGAHPKEFVRPPDWDLLEHWQEAAGGMIRLITMSPEWHGSCSFIERCVAEGITVSIGHTAASPEQIRDAARAGARLVTHFGNGVHAVLPRHPNYLWQQLAEDELWVSLIADGSHLPHEVVKVVLKAKTGKVFLIGDVVALSGMPAGSYETKVGGQVTLTEDGHLRLAEDPRLLAGSVTTLRRAVSYLIQTGLAGREEAWELASLKPARFAGLKVSQGIVPGAPADVVVFTLQNEMKIERVYKAGRLVVST